MCDDTRTPLVRAGGVADFGEDGGDEVAEADGVLAHRKVAKAGHRSILRAVDAASESFGHGRGTRPIVLASEQVERRVSRVDLLGGRGQIMID